jgi:lysozyme
MGALPSQPLRGLLPVLCLLATRCGPGSQPDPDARGHSFSGTGGGCGQLRGIDVSAFNGVVDWAAVADSGISFAFAKASEGLTLRDEQFPANWAGMKGTGIVRGAYHFFHPGDDGAAQADAFLSWVGALEEGDLPPALDWETSDASDLASTIAAARAFAAEILARTGRTTLIYTYRAYWDGLGDPGAFAANPLWFASDGLSCPTPPAPWNSWLFWQYSAEGTVAGISSAVDLDRFAGDREDLLSLAGLDADIDAGTAAAADAGAFVDAGDAEADAGEASPGEASPVAKPPAEIPGCGQRGGTEASLLGPLGLLLRRLLRTGRDATEPLERS